MYRVGPQTWVLLVASLAIPVYGIYLATFRSVDPDPIHNLHSVPYLRYKRLARARSWQRADIAISLSMSVVCCGFSAVLFFGYFKVRSATPYFLYAAVASMLLAFLYTFDALLAVVQLKVGSVDFEKGESFNRSFGGRTKTQTEFTSNYFTTTTADPSLRPAPYMRGEQPIPVYLPSSNSASVPTILQRLRSEIEAEQQKTAVQIKKSDPHFVSNQIDLTGGSWFDEERNDDLTHSTSTSNNASGQNLSNNIDQWNSRKTSQNPVDLIPRNLNETSRSLDLNQWTQRAGLSTKVRSIGKIQQHSSVETDEELPPPPTFKSSGMKSQAALESSYKISSFPYSRRVIVPTDSIPDLSNRHSATTGTSEEDVTKGPRLISTHEPQPAPLIYYRAATVQTHAPAHKARLVMIDDEGKQPSSNEANREKKLLKGPYKAFSHLEGHTTSAKVTLACWNEVHQKLATSDDAGLIIVWMSHATEDTWFEEMINNRQKSSVVALKWSNNGSKIAIGYEDGQVIVGSVDGNRMWSKDIATQLTCLTWNFNDMILLLGLIDGDVHGYDMNGNFAFKVPMVCVDSVEIEAALANGTAGTMLPRLIKQDTFAAEQSIFRGDIPDEQPRFVVAYQHGIIQMMRTENDTSPVVCRLAQTVVVQCAWSPDGSILAVAGYQTDLPEDERNVVHFLTPFGAKIQTMKLSAGRMTGVSWEGSGLRLGILLDMNLYLAIVKPAYKMFYETKMDDYFKRQTAEVWQLEAYEDYCVVVSQVNEIGGMFKMEICDSIGTPVDTAHINIQPFHIAINATTVIVASTDSFLVWHYSIPRRTTLDGHAKLSSKGAEIPVQHIDDFRNQRNAEGGGSAKKNRTPFDNICSVCIGKEFILVGRDSGSVHRYSMPDLKLQQRYQLSYAAEHMALDSTNKRLAFITKHHILKFFELQDNALTVVPNFERRDVWSLIWDKDEDTLVCMEKQKVIVIHGVECEAAIANSGYLCAFSGLTVRCAQLDDVLRDPEHPSKTALVEIETKTLRQAKELLDSDKIAEATTFIESNSHPKLWDLAIDMRTKMHDYFRVLQILQTSSGPGDDVLLQRVWKNVGDFFMERQKWQSATKHYENGQNFQELVKCYLMMDDYARLEALSQQLPDGHAVLKLLAEIFINSGLCAQAVDCYLRLDMITEALDTCIRLNQWDKAVELSEKYHLANASDLLSRYAQELTGSSEKTLAAAQLYRKAAMFLQSARIIFEIANDELQKQAPPLRLKKLFVMAGLLIEQHREHHKAQIAKATGTTNMATIALQGLLSEEHNLSIEDTRLIDTAWRGAEAIHFYMLAHRQLYENKYDAAMRTAIVLTEYEEFLAPLEIYLLLEINQKTPNPLVLNVPAAAQWFLIMRLRARIPVVESSFRFVLQPVVLSTPISSGYVRRVSIELRNKRCNSYASVCCVISRFRDHEQSIDKLYKNLNNSN
ncbi:WD repeat-containing protein 35 [Aphelenchoides besseyi]|nr:WD repeat-containing protein 35 [Aphelenchoides besseyi]